MLKNAQFSTSFPRGSLATRKYTIWIIVVVLCTILLHPLFFPQLRASLPSFDPQYLQIFGAKQNPCRSLPGADQTLVVMKTGATEFIEKFPIHQRTTLLCYPNYLIFSDHSETFRGDLVRNALETVSEEIQESDADFALYRRLRDGGRGGLQPEELSSATASLDRSRRAGWRLDRWKFLPMFNESYHLQPDMKWYMFIETDTYMFWSSVLEFQKHLDAEKPYYMGAQVYFGKIEFGHGGSGLLVSNSALLKLVDYFNAHKEECEADAASRLDGDVLTGKAFAAAGVPMTRSWPLIQGDHPGDFPYGETDQHGNPRWCYPTTTWHHVGPEVIKEMWDFEQKWLATKTQTRSTEYLRYRDVFEQFVMPRMQQPRQHWDNHCNELRGNTANEDECHRLCDDDIGCLQYRYDGESGDCRTSKTPMLGESKPTTKFHSGWIMSRVVNWRNQRPACDKDLWITKNLG